MPFSGLSWWYLLTQIKEVILSSQRSRDSVYKAAEKLINLGQNPSPGSVTWHEAMKSAYNDLVESVIDSENVDISIDPEEI